MKEQQYIVTEKQIVNAVESALKEHIINQEIIGELRWSIGYNVSTVLEDDCEEYEDNE